MCAAKLRLVCTQQLQILHTNLHLNHADEKALVLHREHAENFTRQFVAHVFGTCSTDADEIEIQQRTVIVDAAVQMVSSCWSLQIRCVNLREACPTSECIHCIDEQIRANNLLVDTEAELEISVCMLFSDMYAHIRYIKQEVKKLSQTMEQTPLHGMLRQRVLAPFSPEN
jgi:hypothetical protein